MKYVLLLSRILIVLIFLLGGFGKIADFSGTQGYMALVGMPATAFFLICAIIIETLGGLSILIGFQERISAWVLFIYLIPTTLIFHTKFSDQTQMAMFMKNLAIMGGLLQIAVHGAGEFSLGAKLSRSSKEASQ